MLQRLFILFILTVGSGCSVVPAFVGPGAIAQSAPPGSETISESSLKDGVSS